MNFKQKMIRFFRNRSDLVKVLILLPFLLGFIILLAGFFPISLPVVSEKLSQGLSDALGAPCRVGKTTVTLWSGVSCQNIVIRTVQDLGVSVEIPRLQVNFNLIPLVFKHIRIQTVSVEKPIIQIRLSPLKKTKQSPKVVLESRNFLGALPEPFSRFTLSVGLAEIVSGQIRMTGAEKVLMDCKELGIKVHLADLKSGATEITVKTVRLVDAWHINNVICTGKLENSDLRIEKLQGDLYGGRFKGKGVLDWVKARLITLNLNISGLDVGQFYADIPSRQGRLEGRADASVTLKDCALEPDSLKGEGELLLSQLDIEEIPIQKVASIQFLLPLFKKIMIHKLKADFHLASGRVCTDKVSGEGDLFRVSANGWLALNGDMDENLQVTMLRPGLARFSKIMQYAFMKDSNGDYILRAKLTGTFSDPTFTLDRANVRNSVEKIFRDVGRGLRGLFGRK